MTTPAMKVNRMFPWFGSDLAIAKRIGTEVSSEWVGVLFAGGCSILPFIECRAGIASDLHRHAINCARVIRDPILKTELIKRLDAALFHPDEMAIAQERCIQRQADFDSSGGLFGGVAPMNLAPDLEWAVDYFIASWMGRGAAAGTEGEFDGNLSIRRNANGGGSNKRFRSAVESIEAWHVVAKKWEWFCEDAFDMLRKIKDAKGLAIYSDAPWVGAGDGYRHKFTESHHRRLASMLTMYRETRVVVRYDNHPLVHELYTPDRWTIIEQASRDQDNKEVSELLLINGNSRAGGVA